MSEPRDFEKCVVVKKRKDGRVEIACKLGLWSVAGPEEQYVRQEALRYWYQYARDKEYDELLGVK